MWEKGHSGNPNGARRPRRWQDALDRALEQYEKGEVKAGQALRAIADKVVSLALEGNKDAYQEIANRLDGKADQNVTVAVDPAGVESLSIFTSFLSEAVARAATVEAEAVDTGGPVLPAEVRPTTH